MRAKYEDILETMNQLVRDHHEQVLDDTGFYPDGCTGTAGEYRSSPPVKPCACTVEPLWFDENGVPRFRNHHPDLSPDIYAFEVALVCIACASCAREFHVQLSWGSMDDVRAFNLVKQRQKAGEDITDALECVRQSYRLSAQARDRMIHYGDPPRHDYEGRGCCAGDTMNCDDIAVVEFWTRDGEPREWRRVPELEVALVDVEVCDAVEDGPL